MKARVVISAPVDDGYDVGIDLRRGKRLVRDTDQIYDAIHAAFWRVFDRIPVGGIRFEVWITGSYDRRAFTRFVTRLLKAARA